MKDIPPEFAHYAGSQDIPWDDIAVATKKRGRRKGSDPFESFTSAVIEIASEASMKEPSGTHTIAMGMEACLVRGRMPEALFLSTDSTEVSVLSLRAIALAALSDIEGLQQTLNSMEKLVSDKSSPADRVRLSTARVLTAAVERDTSVISCVMEFDNLLETYPEQVEDPLIETMFTLYVVGTLLREVSQTSRASRIADTLEQMAEKKGHRMFLALVENLRGNICNLQGDLSRAQEHYIRFKEISEELSFHMGEGMALNNLGTLRLNSLSLEEALQSFQDALVYMDTDIARQVTLVNLGTIAVLLGKQKEAEQYLKEAIRLEEKTRKGIVDGYAWYAIMLARQGKHSEVSKYLRQAASIGENSERPLQRGAFLLGKGICEAAAGKLDQALETLGSTLALAKDNSIFELLVQSELELARTHLQAYMEGSNRDNLAKAAYHLGDVIQLSKEQGLHSLYAYSLVLRSDVMRLAGKQLEAKGDLERALSLASFVKDTRMEQQAQERIKRLPEPVVPLDEAGQAGIIESLDRLSAFKPLGQMKEVPRPQLHVLLALRRDSGLPEFLYQFGSQIDMDSTIMSGFISAISSFSNSLMGNIGLLRSINHEGFVLMMEYTASRIVTLIANEESFDVRYRLHSFAERFESQYPPVEGRDEVDASEYTDAEELVREIFSE